jgi:hypothetical protein
MTQISRFGYRYDDTGKEYQYIRCQKENDSTECRKSGKEKGYIL